MRSRSPLINTSRQLILCHRHEQIDALSFHLSSIRSFAPSKNATNAELEPSSIATSIRSEFNCFLIDSGAGSSRRSWTNNQGRRLSPSELDAGQSSIESGMVPIRRLVRVAVLSVATRVLFPPEFFAHRILTAPTLAFGEISLTKASSSSTRTAQVMSLGAVNWSMPNQTGLVSGCKGSGAIISR